MMRSLAVMALTAGLVAAQAGERAQLEDELALPALGFGKGAMPRLDLKNTPLAGKYADPGVPVEEFRKAVRRARVILWASSPQTPPASLRAEVNAAQASMKVKGTMVQAYFAAPKNPGEEKAAKERMVVNLREVARVVARLEAAAEDLEKVGDFKARECPRWQAHHALVSAAVTMRICHLNEYAHSLGVARKEYPPRDAGHKGWRLDPVEAMQESATKKLHRQVPRMLDDLSKAHPGTAWDQMAESLKKTRLSVAWVAK